jgi:hypothetical protein
MMLSAFTIVLDLQLSDGVCVMQTGNDGKASDPSPASMPGAAPVAAAATLLQLQQLCKKPGTR